LGGASTATTTTDVNGAYSFSGLEAGNYTVGMTIPSGYNMTTSNPVSFTLLAATTTNFGVIASTAPNPMTVISWGQPAYASDESGTKFASNVTVAPGNSVNNTAYDTYDFHSWKSVSVPAWVAIDLSAVPSAQRGLVDVLWYNTTAEYDCCGIASGGSFNGLPKNYTIEANAAAGGNATPPASGWVTLATITNNTLHDRENIVNLTGYNWIRLNISSVNGTDTFVQLTHFDVFDISTTGGVPQDSWIFYGDSITLGATNYAEVSYQSIKNFTFSTLILSQLPSYFPAQTDGGIVGAAISDGVNHINSWLSNFPGRYVDISYGTNDATNNTSSVTFYNNYALTIQAVINAGKIPIVPKIPWASNTTTQSNVPRLNQQINNLYDNYPQIIRGPDFYTYFYDNQSLISSGDVHPTAQGYANMRKIWACQMLINVYNIALDTVSNSSDCSPFAAYLLASTHTITASSGVNGSVTPAGVTTKNYNTTQTYTITPDANYHILDVLVDDVSISALSTYDFTNISANHTISATFAINTYTVTGIIFLDVNSNGVKDAGEINYQNVTVTLGGASTATTTTDVNGAYSFGNLSPGEYTVTISSPDGYSLTTSNPVSVTITSGNNTTNFGLHSTITHIAVTASAAKLVYNIGDKLDITGLVITGTYSDSSTQIETVTTDNVSGFDSGTPVLGQVLTITVNGKTTTYTVDILTNTQTAPVEGSARLNNLTPQVVITNHSEIINIIVTPGTVNPTLNLAKLINGGAGDIPEIVLTSPIANIKIPSATVSSTDINWNGIIAAPTIATNTSGSTPAGFNVGDTSIEVGSTTSVLRFSEAVKITLFNVTGRVGYKLSGSNTWTMIDTLCTSATDHSNISYPNECYYTSGSNTIIWTYHFTEFGGLDIAPRFSTGGMLVFTNTNKNTIASSNVEGCALGNLFNTTTGQSCPVTLLNTFEGCTNRNIGFSVTTGKSCTGNTIIIKITTLKLNTISKEVKALQVYLNTHGYAIARTGPGSLGNETTKFGRATLKAVKKFQKDNSLTPDGIVGVKTLKLMGKIF
ncbi:MAG: SdrD B-like domain-containing protein, partial [Bacteroidota bacterium]